MVPLLQQRNNARVSSLCCLRMMRCVISLLFFQLPQPAVFYSDALGQLHSPFADALPGKMQDDLLVAHRAILQQLQKPLFRLLLFCGRSRPLIAVQQLVCIRFFQLVSHSTWSVTSSSSPLPVGKRGELPRWKALPPATAPPWFSAARVAL